MKLLISFIALLFFAITSCTSNKEKLINNNWKFSNFQITDQKKFDDYKQHEMDKMFNQLNGKAPESQVQRAMEQMEDALTESFQNRKMSVIQLNIKDDNSLSVVDLSGESNPIAKKWSIDGNQFIISGSDIAGDTSEIVSLTKSELVLKSHGGQTTFVASE